MIPNSRSRFLFLIMLVVLTPLSVGFFGPQTPSQPNKGKPPTEKAPKDDEPALSPKLLPKEPIKPAANDDELRKLLIARYNEAREETRSIFTRVGYRLSSKEYFDPVFDASQRLVVSRLDISRDAKEDIEILEEYLEILKEAEKGIGKAVNEGRAEASLLHKARYFRLDAEIQLLKAKQKE
jgi:hypothetical protein